MHWWPLVYIPMTAFELSHECLRIVSTYGTCGITLQLRNVTSCQTIILEPGFYTKLIFVISSYSKKKE